MNWTKYNGQSITLPPRGQSVLVKLRNPVDHHTYVVAMRSCVELWYFVNGNCPIQVGDSWMPLPTQAQCEAWELLKNSFGLRDAWPLTDVLSVLIKAVGHLLHDHNCDHQGYEQWGIARDKAKEYAYAIKEALAAIEAAEKEAHDAS